MSRYTGPRRKIMSRLGVDLPGLSTASIEERPNPPGQHGARAVGGRKSEFGLQLMEKQKLRFNYGVSERQLRRAVTEAKRLKGATGSKIVELLERRLDNLVFRAGFAPTVPAARQLVSHGHFTLNGRRVTVPSIRLRVGDEFAPTESGRSIVLVGSSLQKPSLERPEWLALDGQDMKARLTHLPEGDSAPFPLDLQRVVEYYSTRT
jgi:small subunit ribosomal protein S4